MRLSDRFPAAEIRSSDDIGHNPTQSPTIAEIIDQRLSRRDMLRGVGLGTAASLFASTVIGRIARADDPVSSLTFEELEQGIDETHHVANGYNAEVLVRWGDKVTANAPAFDAAKLTAAAQEKQFGYNCDYIGYAPLPAGSQNSENGLLFVNHEYTSAELMFSGITEDDKVEKLSADQVAVEMAAHGASVLEVKKTDGKWSVVEGSAYNRRISLATTEMTISGPAAGNDRLKTNADPSGMNILGTLNNCAGGMPPWGTVLTAEENFNLYFGGDGSKAPEATAFERYGIAADSEYAWARYVDRFNVDKEPNEPNRFGWMVEIDPYDPAAMPVKRSALGRFKHEGASLVVNSDGRVVVYMGDDERFDYIYKFVSAGKIDAADRAANTALLDEGTLYVAKFSADGSMNWMPLTFGEGPLTEANGFASQADIVIEARRAADLLEATPMDRPEDIEVNPVDGHVFALLTNNSKRNLDQVDAVNPRWDNTAGHIIEMIPPGEGAEIDHAATTGQWTFFLIAGNPVFGATLYGKGTSKHGWLACPDNCAFDPKGRIWISSDQGGAQGKFKSGDGIWAADTQGDGRAVTRLFYRVPVGAEMCGPCFTPDSKSFFVAVQHPAEIKESTFDNPATRWPDFADGVPPRPSVVAIVKNDGGEIGT